MYARDGIYGVSFMTRIEDSIFWMERIMVTGEILRAGKGTSLLWGTHCASGTEDRARSGLHLDSVF